MAEVMTTERLLNALLKPTYVWRMAGALIAPGPVQFDDPPALRGARTRLRNATKEIEGLLHEWADANHGPRAS